MTAALAAVVISLVALAFRSPEPDAPRIVPAAPAAVADVLSPRPVSHVPDSADRRVTDWVLEHGAHVNGGGRWIRSVEDVPDEPFTLLYVNVAYMKTIDEARFEDLLALNDCNTYFFALAPLEDAQLERLARPGIISLHLDQTAVTNQGLRHVRSFPDLSKLHVAGRHYTDELLETAGDWPDLTALLLISTQVTNDGLAVVGEMTTLTELSLRGGTGFDDNGLGRLSRLTRLASLDLRGTRVTDAGVFDFRTQLPGCAIVWDSPDSDVQAAFSVLNAGGRLRLATDGPSIPAESPADFPARPFTVREIDLRDSTRITDEALESIRQIRDLETLHLPAIGHTDTGLSFLTEIASLKRLILHDIVPDEATIAGLCRVDQLEILEFRGAELSDEERALLEEAIPGCHVIVTSDVPHLNSSDARRPAGTESATIAVGS